MNLITYLRETKAEMHKVTWPSRSTVVTFTIGVVVVSLCVAYFLGFFDIMFSRLLAYIIR